MCKGEGRGHEGPLRQKLLCKKMTVKDNTGLEKRGGYIPHPPGISAYDGAIFSLTNVNPSTIKIGSASPILLPIPLLTHPTEFIDRNWE